MRDCIYLCTSGEEYLDQAWLCIWTLRNPGEFEGDILVFTKDKDVTLFGDMATVIEIDSEYDSNALRAKVPLLYDLSEYDRIMYLDSDIVSIRPVQELFDSFVPGKFNYVIERKPVSSWPKMVTYLNEELISKHGSKPMINSGTFVFDNDVPKEFFERWLDIYDNEYIEDNDCPLRHLNLGNRKSDQAPLNIVVYEEGRESHELKRGIVSFFRQENPFGHTCLIHFLAMKNEWRHRCMEMYAKKFGYESN